MPAVELGIAASVLVVASAFVLEATMGGRLAAYLPTEEAWPARAPEWAMALWPVLHSELKAWCVANDAGLVVVADARVDSTPS